MKLVEIEYEHGSLQLTVDAVRGRFISAINERCIEAIEELKRRVFVNFLKTGIHKIPSKLNEKQKKLNAEIISNFLHAFKQNWIVCKFDILHDISSERLTETIVVKTAISQHFLHPVCEKWAKKLTSHYYSIHPEAKNLYVLDIAKYYPPCPWIYIFWKSAFLWMKKFNLIETDENDRWILESIAYTVDYWSKNPSKFNKGGLLESSLNHNEYLETLEPPAGLPKWKPQFQERKSYIEEIKKLVKDFLQKNEIYKNPRRLNLAAGLIVDEAELYCDKVEKHFRSNGWKKVTIKKEFEKHLEWAIRFQLKKESYSSIAREFDVYASSVKKEVEAILDLIGLKKREIKRGRKKGQTTSEITKILGNLGK